MHFCEKCDNMYYLKIAEEEKDKLIYYCRNCGHEDSAISNENVCVLSTNIQEKSQRYLQVVNEYTKYDPTLPRINTIKCPNQECISNSAQPGDKDSDNEVIYIRYDDTNMKYIYMCAKCNTKWKTDENH
tara:strand:+ start:1832 stop:2218 length:387 start_codon:yes stop_codon:yes gene_type:complete